MSNRLTQKRNVQRDAVADYRWENSNEMRADGIDPIIDQNRAGNHLGGVEK
jgi:hypothetical protein